MSELEAEAVRGHYLVASQTGRSHFMATALAPWQHTAGESQPSQRAQDRWKRGDF